MECSGDAWTYHPDADWGPWDIEAYHIGTEAHGLPRLRSASVWYENRTERLEDLAKYDLVVLGEVDATMRPDVTFLRRHRVTVAGYVSFSEEHRPSPSLPLRGDGRGPGGFDSRYVDYRDGLGRKEPDEFPDFKPAFGGRNYFIDPRSASWQTLVLSRVREHERLGVNAVFFDTFNAVHPDVVPGARALVSAVRKAFPDVLVVVNSYDLYREVGGLVHAVMLESFTHSHGEMLGPSELRVRGDAARLVNVVRGGRGRRAFDVLTLEYVGSFGDSNAIDTAAERAARYGFVAGFWRMLVVNPAIGLRAARTAEGVRVTWTTEDADPPPEVMSAVGTYEVRRLARPFRHPSDWVQAQVVAGGLPAGTRSVLDATAPRAGKVYYAVRARRAGTGRFLIGTPSVSWTGMRGVMSER
jgi:hypothetical protein